MVELLFTSDSQHYLNESALRKPAEEVLLTVNFMNDVGGLDRLKEIQVRYSPSSHTHNTHTTSILTHKTCMKRTTHTNTHIHGLACVYTNTFMDTLHIQMCTRPPFYTCTLQYFKSTSKVLQTCILLCHNYNHHDNSLTSPVW